MRDLLAPERSVLFRWALPPWTDTEHLLLCPVLRICETSGMLAARVSVLGVPAAIQCLRLGTSIPFWP